MSNYSDKSDEALAVVLATEEVINLHKSFSGLQESLTSISSELKSIKAETSHAAREMKAFKKDMQGAKSELTTHAIEQIDEAFFKRYDLINKMKAPIAAKKPLSDLALYLAIGGLSGWLMVLAMTFLYIKHNI
jgi:septation ring formation regulator EzrA